MKILIIDNGTDYIGNLRSVLSDHEVTVSSYTMVTLEEANNFDGIILSGGHKFYVEGSEQKLANEIKIINYCDKPILGICYGFELIAHTFGATLELMNNKEKGILSINVIKSDPIFGDMKTLDVFENHRFVVRRGNENVEPLAVSKDGVEVIKHTSKTIYGTQFHPEMFVDKTDGAKVVSNFLKIIKEGE